MRPLQAPYRLTSCLPAFATVLLVSALGCGIGGIAPSTVEPLKPAQGFAMQGHVHGGQQPITGATIQLYAAGAPTSGGGYGAGAVALIPAGSYFPGGLPGCVTAPGVTCTSLPTTDSTGNFAISNEYNCPSASSQVYIVATGGNPGMSNTNSYITLMSALGACTSTNLAGKPSLSSSLSIFINEVSTVASAYALQQFMSAPAANTVESIGAPGTTYNGVQTGVVGLTNAFSMAPNLFNISTGNSPGTNPAYLVETSQIYTLADILAACINSDPTSSTTCSSLMTDATPSGSTTATDTLQAAYYMVHNPYNNVAKLFTYVPPSPPFTAASHAPVDFTLGVQIEPYYNTGTVANPVYTPALGQANTISIDAYGNIWALNRGLTATGVPTVPASVTELGPTGNVLLQPVSTYTALTTGYGAYSQFTTPPTSNTRTFSGAATQGGIAVDLSNNVWVADNRDATTGSSPAGGSVAYFQGSTSANAVPVGSPVGYYTGANPDGIAIDPSNNVFVAAVAGGNASSQAIDEFMNASGSAYNYSSKPLAAIPYKINGGNTKIAIGQNTNVTNTFGGTTTSNDGSLLWTANETACSTGTTILGSFNQYTTKDLLPTAYSVFATSAGAASTSTSLCPTTGKVVSEFSAPTTNPLYAAIDRNDNVWISDLYLSSTNGFDGVTLLVPNPSTGAVDPVYGSVTYNAGAPGSTATGIKGPFGIAIDGNNNAWVGNFNLNQVAVVTATLGSASTAPSLTLAATPLGPFSTHHTYLQPQFPAIDPSGNVWIVNQANTVESTLFIPSSGTGHTISILIGAAAPVVTPLAVAVANKVLGTKP